MDRPGPAGTSSGRALAALALVFVLLVAAGLYPLGGPHSQVARYREGVLGLLSPFLLALGGAAVAALLALASRPPGRAAGTALFFLTLALNLALHRPLAGQVWLPRVLYHSFSHTSPFAARGMRMASLAEHWREDRARAIAGYWAMPADERRLTTYPSGLPGLYHGVHRLAGASPPLARALVALGVAELGPMTRREAHLPADDAPIATASLLSLLHLLAVGLTPLGVRAIASLHHPPEVALRAAVAAALIPSLQLYAVAGDVLFPPLGLLALYLLLRGAGEGRAVWLGASGALLVLGAALSFAFAPLALLGLLLLLWPPAAPRRWRLAAAWAAGAALAWLGLRVAAFDVAERFFLVLRNNRDFYRGSGRGYSETLLFNALTFVAFCGIVWVAQAARSLGADLRRGPAAAGAPLRLGFALVLALLLLSGSTRGEVERNWMLLMPFAVLTAAPAFADRRAFRRQAWLSALVLTVMAVAIETSFVF